MERTIEEATADEDVALSTGTLEVLRSLAASTAELHRAVTRDAIEAIRRAQHEAQALQAQAEAYAAEQRQRADAAVREAEAFAESVIDEMLNRAMAKLDELEAQRVEAVKRLQSAADELGRLINAVVTVPDLAEELRKVAAERSHQPVEAIHREVAGATTPDSAAYYTEFWKAIENTG